MVEIGGTTTSSIVDGSNSNMPTKGLLLLLPVRESISVLLKSIICCPNNCSGVDVLLNKSGDDTRISVSSLILSKSA